MLADYFNVSIVSRDWVGRIFYITLGTKPEEYSINILQHVKSVATQENLALNFSKLALFKTHLLS